MCIISIFVGGISLANPLSGSEFRLLNIEDAVLMRVPKAVAFDTVNEKIDEIKATGLSRKRRSLLNLDQSNIQGRYDTGEGILRK